MKRYGNLYHLIYDIDNIRLAHKNARKGKTKYDEVIAIDADVEKYVQEIHTMLVDKTFKSSKYEMFIKNDKGKNREIYKLPYFPDRIIQHAIMQVLEPIWKKTLIADTYQAIKGRGVHKCMKKVKHAVIVDKMQYCLQLDVKKFYPSIKNDVLMNTLNNKIKCKDTMWLLSVIVHGHSGVPIGNYISQYFGNLVLNDIDHKIKEVYKIKYYYRYCDDIIILHNDKKLLHALKYLIGVELSKKELSLKGNWQVYKVTNKRPVDCLGFTLSCKKVSVRNKIIDSLKIASSDASFAGLYGWLKHTSIVEMYYKYKRRTNEK